jgi:leucyl/phenylalanyl-tRNA--protein transferase
MLLLAYAQGAFPMADPDTGRVDYFTCDPRAIFDPASWQPPERLARRIRNGPFEIRVDSAFDAVVTACATDRSDENRSWIGERIRTAFQELHRLGLAHSVEAWVGDRLAGGLYGVAIGGAFFGESMFTVREPWARDASKVAFAALMRRWRLRGGTLVDSQYANPHMLALGALEIPFDRYLERLHAAITLKVEFD